MVNLERLVIREADRNDICDVITLPCLKLEGSGIISTGPPTVVLERLCMDVSNPHSASFSPICSSFLNGSSCELWPLELGECSGGDIARVLLHIPKLESLGIFIQRSCQIEALQLLTCSHSDQSAQVVPQHRSPRVVYLQNQRCSLSRSGIISFD